MVLVLVVLKLPLLLLRQTTLPVCNYQQFNNSSVSSIWHMMQLLYPGVPRDLQRHLANVAAICVTTDSDIS